MAGLLSSDEISELKIKLNAKGYLTEKGNLVPLMSESLQDILRGLINGNMTIEDLSRATDDLKQEQASNDIEVIDIICKAIESGIIQRLKNSEVIETPDKPSNLDKLHVILKNIRDKAPKEKFSEAPAESRDGELRPSRLKPITRLFDADSQDHHEKGQKTGEITPDEGPRSPGPGRGRGG